MTHQVIKSAVFLSSLSMAACPALAQSKTLQDDLAAEHLTAPQSYLFIPLSANTSPANRSERRFDQFTYISRYYWRARGHESTSRVQFVCDLTYPCNRFTDLDERMDYVDAHFHKLTKSIRNLKRHALLRFDCPVRIEQYDKKEHGFRISTCINDSRIGIDSTSYDGRLKFINPYDDNATIILYPGTNASNSSLYQSLAPSDRRSVVDKAIRAHAKNGIASGTAMIYGHVENAFPGSTGSRVISVAVDGYTVTFDRETQPSLTFGLARNPIHSGG